VDEGSGSTLDYATNTTWGALSRARQLSHVDSLGTGNPYDWTAFQGIKDEAGGFTETGRTPIFHYVISAHNYDATTSSGISRGIGASDLIVSLGSFTNQVGSANEQAGTLMHELGHNLGLRHGGGDDVNYKPNFLSIMTYAFQMQGLVINGVAGNIDYSRFALATLDEVHLNETSGVGAAAATYGTRRFCGASLLPVTNATAAIDWNCNATPNEPDVAYDVNHSGAANQLLSGFDDWANLKLKGGAIGLAGVPPVLPTTTDADLLTLQVARDVTPSPGHRPLDKNAQKCESALSKALAKRVQALSACHTKQATAARKGKPFDENACEAAAQASYDALVGRDQSCPACTLTAGASLGNEVEGLLDASIGNFFCVGTPTAGDEKCSSKFLKNYSKLFTALLSCGAKRASAALKGKPFDVQACRAAATAKYDAGNGKLECSCPASNGAMLRDDLGQLLQDNESRLFCAGVDPLP
jgi:hypothetical protein